MPNLVVSSSTSVTSVIENSSTLNASVSGVKHLNLIISGAANIYPIVSGGPRLNVVAVSGPPGVVKAEYPVLYNSTTRTISLDLAYFSGIAAGVASVNGQTGLLTIWGTGGNIAVTASGRQIYISGVNIANSGDINRLSSGLGLTGSYLYNLITGASGIYATQSQLANTGQQLYNIITGNNYTLSQSIFNTGAASIAFSKLVSGALVTGIFQSGAILSAIRVTGSNIINNANFSGLGGTLVISSGQYILVSGASAQDHSDAINLSGSLQLTGSYLYSLTTGASGYIINFISNISAGVISINNISGNINIIGQGNVNVTTQGQNIIVSGDTGAYNNFATRQELIATGTGLYKQIYDSGQYLLNYVNSTANNLSETIANTGSILSQQINILSGIITGNGVVIAYVTGLLPTGFDTYYIYHPVTFLNIPKVSITFDIDSVANGIYGIAVSGRSTTGFYVLLTDTIDTSGVFLDVLVKS